MALATTTPCRLCTQHRPPHLQHILLMSRMEFLLLQAVQYKHFRLLQIPKIVHPCHEYSIRGRSHNVGNMAAMVDNSLHSVTFYDISARNQELPQRATVQDVGQNLHAPLLGTVIWHTTNVNPGELQKVTGSKCLRFSKLHLATVSRHMGMPA